MRKNSIKNTRVNAEVQRELSNILRGRDQRSESVAHDICGGSGSGAGSENMQSIYQRTRR